MISKLRFRFDSSCDLCQFLRSPVPWQATGLLTNKRTRVAVAKPEDNTQTLSFKFKLMPSRQQHAVLARILDDQRELYNAALEERVMAFRKAGLSISYMDQCKSLTVIRQEVQGWDRFPANLQRGTLKRLDTAFKGYFARIRRGGKGYPRYKSKLRFNSFEFGEFSGITLHENRLRFKGMPGSLRVHLHRQLPRDRPLTAKFKRVGRKWYIFLCYRFPVNPPANDRPPVGIDVGITTLAALSTGRLIDNPRPGRRRRAEMRRRSRAFARCKKGSNRRKKLHDRLVRWHERIANARKTGLHQVSAALVREHGLIAVEKLNLKGLTAGILAREVHDAGWGMFKEMLRYKAAKAGSVVVEVNPIFTSQDCSGCGVRVPKKLSERWHDCPDCGLSLDRDVNAARNILHRAVVGPGFAKPLVAVA